jgi:hypothetical protein
VPCSANCSGSLWTRHQRMWGVAALVCLEGASWWEEMWGAAGR